MSFRETAWRVFGQEFLASTEEEKGQGERVASYLLSPLGARMNRVLLVGRLAPAESIGKDESQPFFRSRLTDPTAAVAVTAGGFQPRAMAQLRNAPNDSFALVVGKAHLYRGRDGVGYGSVRIEAMRSIETDAYRAQLAETLAQTLDRLELIERVQREGQGAENGGIPDGTPELWIRGAHDALRRYPDLDRTPFRKGLEGVVNALEATIASGVAREGTRAPLRVTHLPERAPRPARSAEDRARESVFLEALDRAAERSADGYADLTETIDRLRGVGMSAEDAETLLNQLEEDGTVEEPIVGKLRRA